MPAFHSSTLVTRLGEEPKATVGLLSTQDAFLKANLGHDNQALADARYDLTQCRELGRIAAHSKTELNTRYRALALGFLREVLDT